MSLIGQSFTLSSLATIAINVFIGQVRATQHAGYAWCFYLLALLSVISTLLTFTSPASYDS